jgi:tRNA-dihydrouridine synthase B
LQIGRIQIPGTGVLAPLAAITSAPFRQVCLEHGCALAVCEMVSAEALVRTGPAATRRLVRARGEPTLVVQLFGGDPAVMARAAAVAVEHAGAQIVDINMGCPVRKVLGCGAGVALMKEPARAEAVVRAVADALGDAVPVSVKMRAGWDEASINAVEVARRVEQAGACAVAVHARTREQVHAGPSMWGVIGEVKRAVRIPVVGNGGVRSAAAAVEMLSATGCDAVMVGRGALGNPWIFEGIRDGHDVTPSREQRFRVLRHHFELYVGYAGARLAALEMRKHLGWYLRGMPGSAMVRAKLQAMTGAEAVRDAIDAYELALATGSAGPSRHDFGTEPRGP